MLCHRKGCNVAIQINYCLQQNIIVELLIVRGVGVFVICRLSLSSRKCSTVEGRRCFSGSQCNVLHIGVLSSQSV